MQAYSEDSIRVCTGNLILGVKGAVGVEETSKGIHDFFLFFSFFYVQQLMPPMSRAQKVEYIHVGHVELGNKDNITNAI